MTRSLVFAIGVVLLTAGVAGAKTKVAVVAFEGDDNGSVSEVVTDLLDGDYTVSGSKQVSRAIDKLGLDAQLSDKDLKKLANELEVDAILRGDLTKKGGKKLLHVKLYVKGKKIRGFKVEFASAKSEKFKTALKDKLDEKLTGKEKAKPEEDVAATEPASDEEDPLGGGTAAKGQKGKKGAKTEKTAKTEAVDEEEKPAKGKKGKKDKAEKAEAPAEEEKPADSEEKTDTAEKAEKTDEEKAEGDKTAEDTGAAKAKKKTASADADEEDVGVTAGVTTSSSSSSGRAANVDAVRIDIGPSVSARTLKFNSRAFEEAPKPYQNAPVGGARVAGELYPLAFGDPHSFISGIGFAGHYDKTLKLNLQSTAQPGTKFPVEQLQWEVGIRMRVAFGHRATSPTATLGVGYFHRKFEINRSQLMEGNIIDLPDVFYKGYDPGIEFRIPIIKQVALLLGGSAVLVSDTGQIQQLYSYGRAKVTGGQGMAGIDVVIANRIAFRVTGEMAQFGFAFTGNGQQTYNRDNDPSTPDVGGAADRYFGGAATLAVLY